MIAVESLGRVAMSDRVVLVLPSRLHDWYSGPRDNPEGHRLAGSDPACWARPSRLMEQVRRQAFQVIGVWLAHLAPSI
jgi:hypothetical protein